MRLSILGSGTPVPDGKAFGSAYLVETGETRILFDCGPATTQKLAQIGVGPTSIDTIFFTHHHFDHDVDYPCFLLSRWDQCIGSEPPLEVFGPPPTRLLTHRLIDETDGAFAHDWIARINHPMSLAAYQARGGDLPRRPPAVEATDLMVGGEVGRDTWHVRAALANHAQPWIDSLAYRLTTPDGSLVVTGDTTPCDSIAELARDADTLVMSCLDRQETLDNSALGAGIAGTTGAAMLAQAAGVKRLVMVHQFHTFAKPGLRERGIAEVSSIFHGEVIFGEELMEIEL